MGKGKSNQDYVSYGSFDPKAYINEYYASLTDENLFLLEFLHNFYSELSPGKSLLEFGGGPVIYQLLSARDVVSEITFADHLVGNRDEIQQWRSGNSGSFQWDDYLRHVLSLEGEQSTDDVAKKAEEKLRSRVTEIIECDAYLPDIIPHQRKFDIVSTHFCLECISPSKVEFCSFMASLGKHLKPGGYLVQSFIKNADYFTVDGLRFPVVNIDEKYVRSLLKDLDFTEIDLEIFPVEGAQGYDGLIAVTARNSS